MTNANLPADECRRDESNRSSRLVRGLAAVTIILVVWLIVLPRLGQTEPVRKHVDAMRAHNIEASAKFYTELNWTPPTGPVWRVATKSDSPAVNLDESAQ